MAVPPLGNESRLLPVLFRRVKRSRQQYFIIQNYLELNTISPIRFSTTEDATTIRTIAN
jgi:hypothetical protein